MTLINITQVRNSTDLEYYNSFNFSIPYSATIKGLNVYSSYDNVTYILRERYLTTNLVTSSGLIYFNFTSDNHDDDGRSIYFYTDAINSLGNIVSTSNSGLLHTIPINVTEVDLSYNGFSLGIGWKSIDKSNGRNKEANTYNIYRNILSTLSNFTITTKSQTSITIQLSQNYTALFVITWHNRAVWKVYLDDEDTITLSDVYLNNGYVGVSNYNDVFGEELIIYYSLGPEQLLVSVPSGILGLGLMQIGNTFVVYPPNYNPSGVIYLYDDTTFEYNNYYYYVVSSESDYEISTTVTSRSAVYTYAVV